MNGNSAIDSILEKMHDIEGLGPISLWPLAIGWWVVIGLGIIVLSITVWYFFRWFTYRKSWKYDTNKKLNSLLDNLSKPSITASDIQNIASLFSEYLRRIALQKFSRNACAGLTGYAWLEWLSKHDEKKFDWVASGKILAELPYAPMELNLDTNLAENHHSKSSFQDTSEHLKSLILAAKEWVR